MESEISSTAAAIDGISVSRTAYIPLDMVTNTAVGRDERCLVVLKLGANNV